ncbi:hypothetical protein [Parapedobacter pyrenivorans]|uniref:hypothetical protein n=1 Tax=Parapedobacter pyrenivorans TaxID=1305674 RepID=UPI00334264E7
MVKVFSILLMCVYAFSATGATVHLHYCCGKLQELAIQDQKSASHDDCPLCLAHQDKKKAEDCNSSEHCATDQQSQSHCKSVKVDAQKTTGDHLPANDKNLAKIYPAELLAFALVSFVGFPLDIHHSVQAMDAPPPAGAIPLFVRHCTYLI